MATLSVLRFASSSGAEDALETVRELASCGRLVLEDAAVVRWKPSLARPEAWQDEGTVLQPALNAAFWSMLFSFLFFLPIASRAAGVESRATNCSLSDLGISNGFVRHARERIHEGTSALFLLTSDATVDRVISVLHELEFTTMSTNLTRSQENSLRAAFSFQDSDKHKVTTY